MKIQISGLGGPMFLLFLVFLVLKLTNHIDWSWLWVTAPLWGSLVLGCAIFTIWFVIIAIVAIVAAAKS